MEAIAPHKISKFYFDWKGSDRENRSKIELFSNAVSKAMEYCGKNDLMPPDTHWKEASQWAILVNDWFDLLNSRFKYLANSTTKNSFGTDLETKNITKTSCIIGTMAADKHSTLTPFLNRILLNNRSMEELYDYPHINYKVEYILSARLS